MFTCLKLYTNTTVLIKYVQYKMYENSLKDKTCKKDRQNL